MITRGFLGAAALTLLFGCAANPEPAPIGAMNMSMETGTECPMQCPMMQGMHMPNASMENSGMQGMMQNCAAPQDQPAP